MMRLHHFTACAVAAVFLIGWERPAVPRAIDSCVLSRLWGVAPDDVQPSTRHAAAHLPNNPKPKWRRDARALPACRARLALPPVRGDRGGRRLRGQLCGGHPP